MTCDSCSRSFYEEKVHNPLHNTQYNGCCKLKKSFISVKMLHLQVLFALVIDLQPILLSISSPFVWSVPLENLESFFQGLFSSNTSPQPSISTRMKDTKHLNVNVQNTGGSAKWLGQKVKWDSALGSVSPPILNSAQSVPITSGKL